MMKTGTEYFKAVANDMQEVDGAGLVITDWDLLVETLAEILLIEDRDLINEVKEWS